MTVQSVGPTHGRSRKLNVARYGRIAGLALIAAGMVPFAVAAQGSNPVQGVNAPTSGTPPRQVIVKHHAKKLRAGKLAQEPAPVVEPVVEEPPRPNWPVNSAPVPASVAWNGRDLSISATNSSLQQILHDVSTATGLRVDGLSASAGSSGEQRIYGSFGPAPARDVLGKLLEGSGYNVLMIGEQGEGTPRQLVLTAKTGGKAAAAGQGPNAQESQNGDEEVQEDPEPPEIPQSPDPNQHRPFGAPQGQPGQIRTPQQLLQEMQQRQQQMQQQQQQQPAPQGIPVQEPQE